VLDLPEVDRAAVDEVEQAAGRRDQHVRAAGLLGLVVDADAAVDGGDGELARLHHGRQLVDDLRRELTRRRKHERGGPGAAGIDDVGERHAEGERLARAGRRLDKYVRPVEHVGDDNRLDRERHLYAAPLECARNGR
jgi:hypothetical protein